MERKSFRIILNVLLRQGIHNAKSKFILWIEGEATNFVICGVYSGEEDDLSSSKGHINTQPNLRERLTNISGEVTVKTKRMNETTKKQHQQ